MVDIENWGLPFGMQYLELPPNDKKPARNVLQLSCLCVHILIVTRSPTYGK